MGFASTGAADEDSVALGIQEGAGGEFANQPLIDGRVGEGERIQIFENRELGAGDAIADRAGLTMGAFGPDQAGDKRINLVTPGKTLAGNFIEVCAHAVELELSLIHIS